MLSSLTKWLMSAKNTVISGFTINIYNQWLYDFLQNIFEAAEFSFDRYFMFILKEKLHFSLICFLYSCLVKGGWALKVASQFAIQGLVA